ncbi:potassium-transporting ATPase subunit C [Flavobacterium sp. Arc3]|jgi:K+-transporting ATPase ATPase C chain|uniref:potassium-transporting ATPase subunit C n=1 Tax=unclassified Flavobacterium TaxID=196869 RepID=UPI00352C26C6
MMKTIILKRSNTFLSIPFFGLASLVLFVGCQKSNSDQSIRDPKSIYKLEVTTPTIDKQFSADVYFWSTALGEEFDKVGAIDSSKVTRHSELFYPIAVTEKLVSEKKITVHRKGKSQSILTESKFMSPNITIDCAKKQVARIAKARNISTKIIDSIIVDHTEKRLITCLGPKTINIVMLNSELDKITK